MKKSRRYLVSLMITIVIITQIFTIYAQEATNGESAQPIIVDSKIEKEEDNNENTKDESDKTEITIFHTNDIHGRYVQEGNKIQIGNIATLKKNVPNSMLVDAGDNLHGLPFVNLNKGMDAVTLMKFAGYDYMVPGNHDFNYGYERLLELASIASKDNGFEIIASNISKQGSNILKENDIKYINGVKVGIFGLSTPETTYKTNPKNVIGLDFENPIESSKKQVKSLKGQGADVIIALSHIGMDESINPTTIDIAKQVEGIDVIIDGNSHTVLDEGKIVGNTLIVSAGEYLNNIGEVKITIDNNEKTIVNKSARLIGKEEALSYESDEIIDAKINEIKEAQKLMLSKVVGKTTTILDGDSQNVRTGETNLGNLINDAILYETNADIAINAGGNIRKTIPKGDITKGDIIDVLPLSNITVTKTLTGSQIKQVLEHGIKDYPAPSGGFPHVAGISYSFDPEQSAGSRIVSIIKDDKPLDMNKKYVVATNYFLSEGGDDFPCFDDVPIINEFGGLEESLERFITKLGIVSYEKEGRITIEAMPNQDSVNAVIEMIDKLPEEITIKDKPQVAEIVDAYERLTEKEKELVTNLEKLIKAEEKLKELENIKPDKDISKSDDNKPDSGNENSIKPPQTGDVELAVLLFGLVSSSIGLYNFNKN
ncbi:bifunctional metallophosphatase/5'-nucleotidase [Romboutsia sp.]|uniref:bifunctional metallophosphatase/5'-nucleotidase n=1 Tax=Romboutsia sp. TaxID=1965302 RepID=UPI002D10FE56|nr:5'-nucleotidase C-terminal domain-containing protein [Romboutsia sp.]HSQ89249.1 5'-nucleotidase C-terminal domain-containing protein [Romboutsia sp.]